MKYITNKNNIINFFERHYFLFHFSLPFLYSATVFLVNLFFPISIFFLLKISYFDNENRLARYLVCFVNFLNFVCFLFLLG